MQLIERRLVICLLRYLSPNFTVFTRLKRNYLLSVLLGGVITSALNGQAPLVNEQPIRLDEDQRVVFEWRLDIADELFKSGLSVLAENLYRDLLQMPELGATDTANLKLHLAKALIAQRQFANARTLLEEIASDQRTADYYLYLAISAYGNGRKVNEALLKDSLAEVNEVDLSSEDLPWFYLLKGLAAEFSGDSQAVSDAFKQAQVATVSETQRAFFDGLILREELLQAPTNQSLVKSTQNRWKRLSGTAEAYLFVREYAIILYEEGRTEEAVEMINRELSTVGSGYENWQREQLLLLKGVLYGVDTLSGRDTLRSLLREGKNRDVMATALQLLASASGSLEQAELADFLNLLIAQEKPHPLLGQLYYLRSQIALERGETELAEADAKLLLEQFPGLSNITNVYRLLAYAALQKEPSQYRAAADFLIQMRDQSEAQTDRRMINQLIGDCYFLNNDYLNAVDFYQLARADNKSTEQNSSLFLRLITAAIRSGQIDLAIEYMDEADFEASIPVTDQWQAEWNLALALQANGQLDKALSRIHSLLEDTGNRSVPTMLDLRLRWLEARLFMLLGNLEGLQSRIDVLLNRIESIPDGSLEQSEVEFLRTEVILLKADFLIKNGESAAGIELLKLLRDNFTDSSAAEQSYLIEAGYYASVEDFKAAQQALLKLASTYPTSALAPQALYEAGIYGGRLEPDQYVNAVRIFNDLTERFPNSPLYFFARLKQGDLLRQMNDFAAAQIVYEDLIRSFPEHPRRYLAELSRIECMLALSKGEQSQLQNVALELDRLIDMPNLPADFKVEIGFKWGFALQQSGAKEKAQEVFALISGQFLLDDETQLGTTGRYWLSRLMLELGNCLEEKGELAEARRVYRKMVAYNLPGRNLAQSRANRLLVIEE